jgi:hypothetical protein
MGAWILGIGFVVLVAAGLLLELKARRSGSGLPTMARLMQVGIATRTGRVLVVLIWWWLGWHFLAR